MDEQLNRRTDDQSEEEEPGARTRTAVTSDSDIDDDEAVIARLAAERNLAMRTAQEAAAREAASQAVARELAIEREEAEKTAAEVSVERRLAERRANEASREATNNAFAFYLVLGILLALLIVVAFWLIFSADRDRVTVIQPGFLRLLSHLKVPGILGCSSVTEMLGSFTAGL